MMMALVRRWIGNISPPVINPSIRAPDIISITRSSLRKEFFVLFPVQRWSGDFSYKFCIRVTRNYRSYSLVTRNYRSYSFNNPFPRNRERRLSLSTALSMASEASTNPFSTSSSIWLLIICIPSPFPVCINVAIW